MGWEIYPDGLYNILNRLAFDYQVPKIYITENGVSFGMDRMKTAVLTTSAALITWMPISGPPTAPFKRRASGRLFCLVLAGQL
jgi:hypothetical protein